MIDDLADYWKSSRIITDEKVIKAFKAVPRENFIRDGFENEAYGDYPLPIGFGQTISQPTTIAIMTQALELKKGNKVLEVGAGSGYQSALIANIVGNKGRVIATEFISDLAEFAKNNLAKSNIKNAEVINCDGSLGYKKEAPYDRCIITAACPKIPHPIIKQLKDGGIVVAPVGSLVLGQSMLKVKKKGRKLTTENLGSFVFVPLKGKYGY